MQQYGHRQFLERIKGESSRNKKTKLKPQIGGSNRNHRYLKAKAKQTEVKKNPAESDIEIKQINWTNKQLHRFLSDLRSDEDYKNLTDEFRDKMGIGVSDNPQILEDLKNIYEEQLKDKTSASSRYSSVKRKRPDVIIKKITYAVEAEPVKRTSFYSKFNPVCQRQKSDLNPKEQRFLGD